LEPENLLYAYGSLSERPYHGLGIWEGQSPPPRILKVIFPPALSPKGVMAGARRRLVAGSGRGFDKGLVKIAHTIYFIYT